MQQQILKKRTDRIKERLNSLKPTYLEIIDESSGHQGHYQSSSHETHLKLIIAAQSLGEYTLLKQHKIIKELIAEEFDQGLHALTIKVINEKKDDSK